MTVNANLFARLQASFQKHANRVAIETPAGQIYDYADLEREAGRYAGFLRAQGVQQGDRVAVQVEKSPESLFLYLACLQAGAVYVPLNTAYRPAELSYFLGDAEPALMVSTKALQSDVEALARQHQLQTKVFSLDSDGTGSLATTLAGSPASTQITAATAADLAVIIYTSGTTG